MSSRYWYLSGITNNATRNPQTFRNDPAQKAVRIKDKPPLWYARTVGGTSVHYTANCWRFHDVDFNERSRLGAIPGADLADWPISYAELEPYYTKVDWEIGVSGLAGASPFEPPRTKPYPMPPRAGEIIRGAVRAGRTQVGPAPISRPVGDQLPALPRSARLRELWLLSRLCL